MLKTGSDDASKLSLFSQQRDGLENDWDAVASQESDCRLVNESGRNALGGRASELIH